MNSQNRTWESLKTEYLHQVEKALSLVNHPRRKDVLADVSSHLDRRFAELRSDEHTWENFQSIITDMGPPSEYAELLDTEQTLKKQRPSLKFVVLAAVVLGIVAAAILILPKLYQRDWQVVKPTEPNIIVPGVRVGGYKLGISKDDVLKSLGKPRVIFYGKEKYTLDNLPRRYFMVFDDLSFGIVDDSVQGITALSPRYKFANGLGVGDSEQKVKETFGNDFDLKEFNFKNILTYKNKGLSFEIRNDNKTVMEINVSQKTGDRGKNAAPSRSKMAVSGEGQHLVGTMTFTRLAFPQPDTVENLDLTTGKTRELLRATTERPVIQRFRYSPDGQRFVVVMGSIENERANTEIYMGDDTGGKLNKLTHNNIYDGYPTWSPDGKRIVFMRGIRGTGRFRVLNLESQQEWRVSEPGFKIHRWADWLPDGQHLLVVAKTHLDTLDNKEVSGLAKLNLGKGTARWLYKGDVRILTPRFSPDGTRIACVVRSRRRHRLFRRQQREFVYRVYVLNLNVEKMQPLNVEKMQPIGDGPSGSENDFWPVWSPDGKRLAWIRSNKENQTCKVLIHNFEVNKLQNIRLPEDNRSGGYWLTWSPDGKHLACVTSRQPQSYTLRVVTLKSGKSREVLTSKLQIHLLYWH